MKNAIGIIVFFIFFVLTGNAPVSQMEDDQAATPFVGDSGNQEFLMECDVNDF